MTEIVWEDPPEAWQRNRAEFRNVLAELKKNPGKWALVRTDVASGTTAAWKANGCEVTFRTIKGDDGKTKKTAGGTTIGNLYAMWPGDSGA